MGRVLEVLVPVAILVVIFNVLLGWRIRVHTQQLREENTRLLAENTALRADNSDRELVLQAENAQLHRLADRILTAIAERPNPLTVSGPYQPIIDIIASQRPERNSNS